MDILTLRIISFGITVLIILGLAYILSYYQQKGKIATLKKLLEDKVIDMKTYFKYLKK